MPNSGHKWTEQEEKDALSLDWSYFNSLYPHITRDAWRIRRNILRRAGIQAIQVPAPSKCKVCSFIDRLKMTDAIAWLSDLASRAVSHRAVEASLRRNGVAVEESSVRRHRRNHMGGTHVG